MASPALEIIAEVILTPSGRDTSDSVGIRTIAITPKQPLITVGRSSRNKTKNLLPDSDNAYFDSPVMSREHAWIKHDDEGKIVISDAGSMHGTFLNDKILEPKKFVPLETGAAVRFGNSVTRGSDTFPPKSFSVTVTRNNRMAELQHGYGITSEELILPDSPYSSEDDEDDVMITDVKTISKPTDSQQRYWSDNVWEEERSAKNPKWDDNIWSDERPSEQPVTVVRESLRDTSATITDCRSIIRNTSHVDLTVEPQTSQQSGTSHPRISISELIAPEHKSRQPSQTPVLEGAASHPVTLDSDTEDIEECYMEYNEEESGSSDSCELDSVPTSPVSEEYASEAAKKSYPLPYLQHKMVPIGTPTLERVPALDELVSPEVKQAWTNTWKAPLLSPFGYTSSATSTTTRDTMEQVRKAEAMRDRAQEFLRSRIEMQSSRTLYMSPKEKEQSDVYPTPTSANQNQNQPKPDPVIPFWVRNFEANSGKPESEIEDPANEVVTVDSPCAGRGVQEPEPEMNAPLSPAETRSPSPQLKMAGVFEISEDEDEEDEDEDDNWMGKQFLDESSSEDDSSENQTSEASEDEDMEDSFALEISSVEDEEAMDYTQDDSEDDDRDTESHLSVDNVVENLIVHNTVKNAMSMENFFSPNEDTSESFATEKDPMETRWDSVVAKEMDEVFKTHQPEPSVEITQISSLTLDPGLLPPAAKKRKRSESEEAEECSEVILTESESIPPNRKIAPLPRRSLVSMANTLPEAASATIQQEERKEMLALAGELKTELEAEAAEPEPKKLRVGNTGGGASWGATVATALAGALVGGVGVFAALVATAGDI
ncbi:hypothetical protein ABW20_dc0103001 [Dactylellina cionopaga]|nr:hypothetical protein ABW20_dc0103001 [Dactylellina cionopaga]